MKALKTGIFGMALVALFLSQAGFSVSETDAQIAHNMALGLPAGYLPSDTNAGTTAVNYAASATTAVYYSTPALAPAPQFAPSPYVAPAVTQIVATPAPIVTATEAQDPNPQIVPTPYGYSSISSSDTQIAQNMALGLPAGYGS